MLTLEECVGTLWCKQHSDCTHWCWRETNISKYYLQVMLWLLQKLDQWMQRREHRWTLAITTFSSEYL